MPESTIASAIDLISLSVQISFSPHTSSVHHYQRSGKKIGSYKYGYGGGKEESLRVRATESERAIEVRI